MFMTNKHDSGYRKRRNFHGGLIFVLFAGEVDPRNLFLRQSEDRHLHGPELTTPTCTTKINVHKN